MNKPYIKIKHNRFGYLGEKESNNVEMYLLGSYLIEDVGEDVNTIKQLAETEVLSGGNFSSIDIQNGHVRIEENWAKEGDPFIQLPKEIFLRVLDEWEKAYKKGTKEILITREEDGSIKFEVKK